MSKQYSRQQKQSPKNPSHHIKTGFSAFQKTIALIGSILSIIVASFTIKNAISGSSTKSSDSTTSTTQVIIKEQSADSSGTDSQTDK